MIAVLAEDRVEIGLLQPAELALGGGRVDAEPQHAGPISLGHRLDRPLARLLLGHRHLDGVAARRGRDRRGLAFLPGSGQREALVADRRLQVQRHRLAGLEIERLVGGAGHVGDRQVRQHQERPAHDRELIPGIRRLGIRLACQGRGPEQHAAGPGALERALEQRGRPVGVGHERAGPVHGLGLGLEAPVAVDGDLGELGVQVLAVFLEQRVGDVGDLAEHGPVSRRGLGTVELRRQELAGDVLVVVRGVAAVARPHDQAAPLADIGVQGAPGRAVEPGDVEQEDAGVGRQHALVAILELGRGVPLDQEWRTRDRGPRRRSCRPPSGRR